MKFSKKIFRQSFFAKFAILALLLFCGGGFVKPAFAQETAKPDLLYVDAINGNDSNDGSSPDKAKKDLDKAQKSLAEGGKIKIISLDQNSNIPLFRKASYEIIEDINLETSLDKPAISLLYGAKLSVSPGKSLNIKNSKMGIDVDKDSQINDGNYNFEDVETGLNLKGQALGSSKGKLNINIKSRTGSGISYGDQSKFINAIVNVEVDNTVQKAKALTNSLYLENSDFITKGIRFAFEQKEGSSDLYMDNSNFQAQGNFTAAFASGLFKIGSKSTALIKNSSLKLVGEGIYVTGKADIENSSLNIESGGTHGILLDNGGSLSVDQSKINIETGRDDVYAIKVNYDKDKPSSLIFTGSNQVEVSSKKPGKGPIFSSTGSFHIVKGGSYIVTGYSDNFSDYERPSTGPDFGDEKLKLVTLKDSSINSLNILASNGTEYTYMVENPSSDGKKHVRVPLENLTFILNAENATWPDGSKEDRNHLAIRGEKIDLIEENRDIENPSRPGFVFKGWKDETGKIFDLEKEPVTSESKNLFALWEKEPIKKNFQAEVELEGKDLEKGEFIFKLYDKDGKVLDTKANDQAGKINFDPIEFKEIGNYQYKIKQEKKEDSHILFDEKEIEVQVNIKENEEGKLEAQVTYVPQAIFKNIYQKAKASLVLIKKDQEGNILSRESLLEDGEAGSPYDLSDQKGDFEKDGKIYEFVSSDYDVTGLLKEGENIINFFYKEKISEPEEDKKTYANVVVKYLDQEGNEIKESLLAVEEGEVGTSYDVSKFRLDQVEVGEDIYIFEKLAEDSDDDQGLIKENGNIVKYIYKLKEKEDTEEPEDPEKEDPNIDQPDDEDENEKNPEIFPPKENNHNKLENYRLVIHFLDQDGNKIKKEKIENFLAYPRESYDLSKYIEKVIKIGKDSYSFYKIREDSSPISGNLRGNLIEINLIYRKNISKEKLDELKKAIRRNEIQAEAARLLIKYNPKSVAKFRKDLEELIKISEEKRAQAYKILEKYEN